MKFNSQPKPAAVQNHDRFEVAAEGLGRYVIDVSLPLGYEKGGKFPVILMTDGNLWFDLAQCVVNGSVTHMARQFPPSIVVGIGYPWDEGLASFYARRNYDFYGDWDMTDRMGRFLQQIFKGMKDAEGRNDDLEIRAGGFERFLSFLREELLPQLAERYPIDLKARHTLIGGSSGGHFALRALYHPKSPFKRYVIISPPMDAPEGAIQAAEAAFAAAHEDFDVDVFICCGSEEVDDGAMVALCNIPAGVIWTARQFALRDWPSARVHWEIMNHEHHGTLHPRAIAAGLNSVHGIRPGVHREQMRRRMAEAQAAAGMDVTLPPE